MKNDKLNTVVCMPFIGVPHFNIFSDTSFIVDVSNYYISKYNFKI